MRIYTRGSCRSEGGFGAPRWCSGATVVGRERKGGFRMWSRAKRTMPPTMSFGSDRLEAVTLIERTVIRDLRDSRSRPHILDYLCQNPADNNVDVFLLRTTKGLAKAPVGKFSHLAAVIDIGAIVVINGVTFAPIDEIGFVIAVTVFTRCVRPIPSVAKDHHCVPHDDRWLHLADRMYHMEEGRIREIWTGERAIWHGNRRLSGD